MTVESMTPSLASRLKPTFRKKPKVSDKHERQTLVDNEVKLQGPNRSETDLE